MECGWLFKVKVTLPLASQQKSLRDPCVVSLLGFGSDRRALRSLLLQNFGFAQDDIWTESFAVFVATFIQIKSNHIFQIIR